MEQEGQIAGVTGELVRFGAVGISPACRQAAKEHLFRILAARTNRLRCLGANIARASDMWDEAGGEQETGRCHVVWSFGS